jgi:hypothetical protein
MPLLVLGVAMAPLNDYNDHTAGLLAGGGAILGWTVRQFRADRAQGDPNATTRAVLRAGFGFVLMVAWTVLGALLNPLLAADSLAPGAALLSLAFGLFLVADGLWSRWTREQVVIRAAWGGLALIGLGAAAALAGAWPLAVLWLVPGSALVVWQLFEQRRLG